MSDFVSKGKIDLKANDAKSTTSVNEVFTFLNSEPTESNVNSAVWFEALDIRGVLYS
jgi:hypothetical protein